MILLIIRISIMYLYFGFISFLAALLSSIRPFHRDNVSIAGDLIGIGIRFLGADINIIDEYNLYKERPCVFISNHQASLDLFPGGYTIPKGTVTLGKKSIIYMPFFGFLYWISGNILINRTKSISAKKSMEIVTHSIVNKKMSVWIMPEGTRSRGKGLLPFKKGAFRTAIDAQVPIVPIVFSDYKRTINLKKLNAGVINVKILEPISTKGLTYDDLDMLIEKSHSLMKQTLEEIS